MSQTQATNSYWTSNFPSVGLTNGSSAREQQKEEARRQRAQQNSHVEGVGKNHLFGEPRKVKPTEQDPLKDIIHVALGEFSKAAPSIMSEQHQLLFGVSRTPQTPVDGKGSFFGSAKKTKLEELSKKNLSNQRTDNHKTKVTPKQKQPSNSQERKERKNKNVFSGEKDLSLKERTSHIPEQSTEKPSPETKDSTAKHKSNTTEAHKKLEQKDKISKSNYSSSKKHSRSPVNGMIKTEFSGEINGNKNVIKSPHTDESKKKEDGERHNKSKPPKLSMPEKLLSHCSEGVEAGRVDSILKEMTQLVAPPLTGIHTPIKGSNQHGSFPFPDKPVLQDLAGRKKEKSCLTADLSLSDDSDDEQVQQGKENNMNQTRSSRDRTVSTSSSSSGSSDESDSDSSDSESESEGKETGTKAWDLNSLAEAFSQPTTNGAVESPSSMTVGDEGLRGNQIAPGVHASPDKISCSSQEHHKDKDFTFELIQDEPSALTPLYDMQMPSDILRYESPVRLKEEPDKSKTILNESAAKPSVVNDVAELSVTNSHEVHKKETGASSNQSNSCTNSSNSEPLSGDIISKEKDNNEKKKKRLKVDETKSEVKESKISSKLKKEKNNVNSENKKVERTVEQVSTAVDTTQVDGKSRKDHDKRTIKKKHLSKKKPSNSPNKADAKRDGVREKEGDMEDGLCNTGTKVLNGYSSPLADPVKEFELPVTRMVNGENQHDSLIVTIDLGLLQRIPKAPGTNGTIVAKLTTSSTLVGNGKVKIKRQSSVDRDAEPVETKKARAGVESESDERRHRERTSSTSSSSSRYSTDRYVSSRKRSPSQESDHQNHHHKRRRHVNDSRNDRGREGRKRHEHSRERKRDRKEDNQSHRDRLRDLDKPTEEPIMNGYSPNNRDDVPCWCGNKKDDTSFSSYLEQVYNVPDPRVPQNPDHYLQEAKKLKHKADGVGDKKKKAISYVEAVIQFMKCGRALEQNETTESITSACQMYRETRDLLSYAMRQFVSRLPQQSDGSSDKRLMALCLRIQSVLHMKMYRLRKDLAQKNNRILLDYFKDKAQQPKGNQAPSPYNSNPSKMTGTPSPLSPTPSPSGSIGSIGSVGSTGSQETVATPSRNNKQPSNALASPGNVCIPQRIYSLTSQHLNVTSHLVVSHEKWDQAQALVLEYKDFFTDLDKKCGPLTSNSSVARVSEYVQEALSRLKSS